MSINSSYYTKNWLKLTYIFKKGTQETFWRGFPFWTQGEGNHHQLQLCTFGKCSADGDGQGD